MKQVFLLLVVGLLIGFAVTFPRPISAQECTEDAIRAISGTTDLITLGGLNDKCNAALKSMEQAVQPHVDELDRMNRAIAAFQERLKVIDADVVKKTAEITQGEKELEASLDLASKRIRQFYIRSYTNNPMYFFLSSTNIGLILRTMAYQQAAVNQDKRTITETALAVKDLEDRKKSLESEQALLSTLKADTDRRAESVRKLVAEANAYEAQLRGAIAAITAQQESILSARSGTFTTSVGDVPLADDPNASPNFNPGFSPAFAGFSFGAYTHRKGMSQYGAKGRADNGQSYRDILQAYYHTTPVGKDTGGTISVSGFGSLDFEGYYLMGIAEMPSSFPKEALRAQAVAARSYAYGYKTQGQTICTSEACQVFSKSKADNPPSEWRQAVEETRGQVLDGVTAFYSSTTGGYITTMGWDTKCGNQGCWTGDAYEKIASSPWFYKGWYTADYYNSSAKCGRSHPWLTGEEFADILNAWEVLARGGDKSRVLPTTINSCSVGGASGNPYSLSEMRDAANSLGGAYSSVSSVSVTYNGGGYTDTVILQTNRGEVRISGSDFKQAFNLRAPGYISIRSPLFNIEQK